MCPCPKIDYQLLAITGDQGEWVLPLVQKRSLANNRGRRNTKIRNNVIGKSGTSKTWYTFNSSFLNGIFPESSIGWCNPAHKIQTLSETPVEAEKLDILIKESKYKANKIYLCIAQGNPLLTLKRAQKILGNCIAIDLSLHPFTKIWAQQLDTYLKEEGFKNTTESPYLWAQEAFNIKYSSLYINRSQSIQFLSESIETLANKIDLTYHQSTQTGINDLDILKNISRAPLRGSVDEFDGTFLEGWVDSYDFGTEISEVNVLCKHNNQSIGHGLVNIKRPDLGKIGIKNIKCGFSIKITPFEDIPLGHRADTPIILDLIESKSGKRIGDKSWQLKQALQGQIDGFDDKLSIRGWVDSASYGTETSEINVIWKEKNQSIGHGLINIDRPDLAQIGIKNTLCGFSIDINLFKVFPKASILDSQITLDFLESKTGQPVGGSSWALTESIKVDIINKLIINSKTNEDFRAIEDYLIQSTNSIYLVAARKKLLQRSSLYCQSGQWNKALIGPIINLANTNQLLDYGSACESASRVELIFSALILLIDCIDHDKINAIDINHIFGGESREQLISRVDTGLKERQFVGLQAWEKTYWDKHLRSISYILIATLFLQSDHRKLKDAEALFDTLALIAEKSFRDNQIAFYFRSIINVQRYTYYDQNYINLAHSRADRFNILLATYANDLHGPKSKRNIYYLAAAIDFASGTPSIYKNLTEQFLQVLPDHLSTNIRQSKPKHWIDRLGFLSSDKTQAIVSEMLSLGISREDIIEFHQKMISIKILLAEMLWCSDDSTRIQAKNTKESEKSAKNWLIIGDENLKQCWMYRVEQKKNQLENSGCNVRCIDQEELRDWSFSHQMIWADAIIVCRLPAMYHVFRAMAFAKHRGVKLYAEIDDLLFTPEYPAAYQSYGGTIPLLQYKNLCVDYPLRLGVLNYADEIIVTTSALAEQYHQITKSEEKIVNILPNLPLDSLHNISKTYQKDKNWNPKDQIQRIALTSGTLSHKQILKDTIFPALAQILEQHQDTYLTIIGHIDLPASFQKFEDRLTIVPFTTYENYLDHLAKCTITLVPLEKHITTDCKSAIKWMEASLCGVTSICSPVRAYTDVTTDGEDVIIAESLDEWRNGLNSLLSNPELRASIGKNAFLKANKLFNQGVAVNFWSNKIKPPKDLSISPRQKKKVLLINVYFAPQSIGGATRVAQDYVRDMLADSEIDHEVTILCIDCDNWQANPLSVEKRKEEIKLTNSTKNESDNENNNQVENPTPAKSENENNTIDCVSNREHKYTSLDKKPITQLQSSPSATVASNNQLLKSLPGDRIADNSEIDNPLIESDVFESTYRDTIYVDESHWNGARVIRLNISPKPWHIYQDADVEQFCEEFFINESFDLIQCHCCQVLTASPLAVAQRMSIPYEIVLHDAWWMSYEQFLVSPAGRVIDPADPLAHFDHQPSEEEKQAALERRHILYEILENAERRIAVSAAFKDVCESAGVQNVSIQENQVAPMNLNQVISKIEDSPQARNYNLCHIGGMSLHKGYQLLRKAVHALPQNLPIQFTVVDHRLASATEEYNSIWNGYAIHFVAPIPMDEMPIFYANHDVLVAPSIWPESFGLVSREALSAGLWVIASDAGALADPIIKSDKPVGTVIRPNHLQDLIDAIEQLPGQLNKYNQGGI